MSQDDETRLGTFFSKNSILLKPDVSRRSKDALKRGAVEWRDRPTLSMACRAAYVALCSAELRAEEASDDEDDAVDEDVKREVSRK